MFLAIMHRWQFISRKCTSTSLGLTMFTRPPGDDLQCREEMLVVFDSRTSKQSAGETWDWETAAWDRR